MNKDEVRPGKKEKYGKGVHNNELEVYQKD